MNTPLKPDPKWRQINHAPFTSDSVNGTIHHPPQAYAKGFENGAYALAEKLLKMFETDKSSAFKLLLEYKSGNAHPAEGWEHEEPRR